MPVLPMLDVECIFPRCEHKRELFEVFCYILYVGRQTFGTRKEFIRLYQVIWRSDIKWSDVVCLEAFIKSKFVAFQKCGVKFTVGCISYIQ